LSRAGEKGPSRADASLSLRGNIDVVSPLDLLEWLCRNRKTGRFHLYNQDIDGEVVIVDGDLVDARWRGLCGMPALCELVTCETGFFELLPVSSPVEQTLHGSWRNLLFQVVEMLDERKKDEKTQGASRTSRRRRKPSSEITLVALASEEETEFKEERTAKEEAPSGLVQGQIHAVSLVDQGFVAFKAGNIEEARRCWSEALVLDLENRSIQFNLRRLGRYS
jgi:hypothetical protein